MEDEDTFLTQMLMELAFESMTTRGLTAHARGVDGPGAGSVLQNMKLSEVPVMDELSRGFWKLREDSEISTWLVFASRILLDIREILGDSISESWGELKKFAHTSHENLQIKLTPQGLIQRGEKWVEKDRAIIEKVYHSSQMIGHDLNQNLKVAWMERQGRKNMSQSYYHTPAEFDAAYPEHIGQGKNCNGGTELKTALPNSKQCSNLSICNQFHQPKPKTSSMPSIRYGAGSRSSRFFSMSKQLELVSPATINLFSLSHISTTLLFKPTFSKLAGRNWII
jgi:hypothetical protein